MGGDVSFDCNVKTTTENTAALERESAGVVDGRADAFGAYRAKVPSLVINAIGIIRSMWATLCAAKGAIRTRARKITWEK